MRPWLLWTLGAAVLAWALSRTERGQVLAADAVEAVVDMATPRGIRNNNPGNIRRTTAKWLGQRAIQADAEFVQFEAPKWGLRALARLLTNYRKAGMATPRQVINRWAPPVGDRNGSAPGGEYSQDSTAYAAAVARELGIGIDAPIPWESKLPELMAAMIRHENGRQPYSAAQIAEGISLV